MKIDKYFHLYGTKDSVVFEEIEQPEKDLVSRKEATRHLKKRLMETAINNVGVRVNADYIFSEMAENRIDIWMDELPAVQPEIIRCGGCRWFGKIDDRFYRKNTCTNPRVGMKVGENDFCSYAEAGEAGE